MAHDKSGIRTTATVERRPVAVAPVQRSAAPARSPAQSIQQRLGYQATQAMLARMPAPPEPTSRGPPVAEKISGSTIQRAAAAHVSSPHDPAEREAEETARKVVHAPHSGPATPAKNAESGTIQRAAESPSSVVTPTGVNLSGSAPLPASVRSYMEPRFGADFGHVRVHHDRPAAEQSAQLGAHAFTVGNHVFFGDGKFQPESDGGRELIAHELTHTIQQGAAVQRSVDATAVQRSVDPSITQRTAPKVQRLGLSDALNWVANKANLIPGFRLLTIVLGVNPVNMSPVDRSAANILRALLELIPVTGALLSQALDNYGIFAKVGAWIETQIKSLGLVGAALKSALGKFLDSLGLGDLLDLGGVWERGKLIFTEPIDKLINFGKSLGNDIIKFIRDAILMPLAKLAEGTKGWDLLIAVLGQNPITGQPVKRDAEHLIGGFMKLIGQEEIWENLQKSHAVPRAWAWFQGALEGLMGFVRQIPGLFMTALHSIELIDIVILPKAFAKVAGVFGNFFGQFFTWAGHTIWTLLEIIFEVVSPATLTYLKKTGAALKGILMNPMPFMRNLVRAAKLGLSNFAEHFWDHLKAGLIDWLTGSLPGIYIPRSFTLQEIFKFVFSVLGLSWANVRAKLVKIVGETAVKVMETGFDIVVTLVTQGPAAAWDKIKEQLSNLKDMVIDGIISFIVDLVVKKAIPKLVSMFIPGAGFISAIVSIYDTIMVFVQKISKIIAVVKSFVDSIVDIANGAIDGAAKRVETTLAGLLSLAISFFAGFVGLGDVVKPVLEVIHKVQAVIDKAIDSLIDWIVKTAKSLFAKAFGKDKPDDRTDAQKLADLNAAIAAAETLLSSSNADEEDIRKKLPAIQSKYKLTSLELVVDKDEQDEDSVHIEGKVNPGKNSNQKKVKKGYVGPLNIKRKQLSFTAATKEYLIKKFKESFPPGELGQWKDARLDIRHKISISDTITHLNSSISVLKVADAVQTLTGMGYTVKGKGRPGIIDSCIEHLQLANNDLDNLFVGAAGKNRSKGKRYDAGDKPGTDPTAEKYDQQKSKFIDLYGVKGTDFKVTIDIVDGSEIVETWEVSS
jgi:hypothetical protein